MLALFIALFIYGYLVTPALTVYSWFRWARSKRRRSRGVRLSLIGLGFASFALALCVGAIGYSYVHDRVLLYVAPQLRYVYPFGVVTASISLLFAFLGAFQSNPIRLKALLIALGTVDLWFLAGSGQ